MSPFGNRPISVDFWVSKQELENERHHREQNEMMNWIRHSEDLRNKPEGMDQQQMGMGGFGGNGYGMQQNKQPRFNQNNGGYNNQQRGGRQGGSYRGGSNRGGHPSGGRPQQPGRTGAPYTQ